MRRVEESSCCSQAYCSDGWQRGESSEWFGTAMMPPFSAIRGVERFSSLARASHSMRVLLELKTRGNPSSLSLFTASRASVYW